MLLYIICTISAIILDKSLKMNLKEELKSATDEEKVRLLASNGMLIKRPILVKRNKVLVGFKEDEWKDLK